MKTAKQKEEEEELNSKKSWCWSEEKPRCGIQRQGDGIRDHEMGIENCAWRDRDRGRNGEKAYICSTPAARLKELSPPCPSHKTPQVQAFTTAELRLGEKWGGEECVDGGAQHGKIMQRFRLRKQWVFHFNALILWAAFTAGTCSSIYTFKQ